MTDLPGTITEKALYSACRELFERQNRFVQTDLVFKTVQDVGGQFALALVRTQKICRSPELIRVFSPLTWSSKIESTCSHDLYHLLLFRLIDFLENLEPFTSLQNTRETANEESNRTLPNILSFQSRSTSR